MTYIPAYADKGNNMSEVSNAVINKVLSIQNLNNITPGIHSSMLLSYHGYLFYQKRALLSFQSFLLSIISDAGL